MKPSSPNLYLLGEEHGSVMYLESGQIQHLITEFMTIDYAIALFVSRLDAEICKQYLNQCDQNRYKVLVNSNQRVGIIKEVGDTPASLVVGFVLDQATGTLVVQGGIYSLMHFSLNPDDQSWLLDGGSKPAVSVIDSARRTLSQMGGHTYIDELEELEKLDEKSLSNLAKIAVQQAGILQSGNPTIAAVFSPRRKAWIELKQDNNKTKSTTSIASQSFWQRIAKFFGLGGHHGSF